MGSRIPLSFFTIKQAMRTPTFWLMIVAQSTNVLALPAIRIHGIPFLTDLGIDPIKSAGMMSLMVFSSLPTRLIGGLVVDCLEKKYLRFLLGSAYFLPPLGFALILLDQSFVTIYAWFILYGIGGIGSIPLSFMIRAHYFGRKAYGAIGGSAQMFVMPVGLIAPIYLGWVYDTTGSYLAAFTLVTALLAVGTILMCLIPPPRPPEQFLDKRNNSNLVSCLSGYCTQNLRMTAMPVRKAGKCERQGMHYRFVKI